MDDLISRRAAIDALDGNVIVTSRESAQAVIDYIRDCADRIRSLPSAQPKLEQNIPSEQGGNDKLWVKTGKTCTDTISRIAALDAVCDAQCGNNRCGGPCLSIKALLNLPSAQPETEERTDEPSQKVPNDDLISRKAAVDEIEKFREPAVISEWQRGHEAGLLHALMVVEQAPSAQPEPLTDKEQRIFLSAMGREEKVCKQFDDEYRNCREPYEDSLVSICHEIIRKVKGALWTT